MNKNSLGQKIHDLRTEKSLSLSKLSNLTGISKSRIWELENRDSHRPSMETVKRLAAALNTTIEYLADDSGSVSAINAVDEAFFSRYQAMKPATKERLRKIADILESR